MKYLTYFKGPLKFQVDIMNIKPANKCDWWGGGSGVATQTLETPHTFLKNIASFSHLSISNIDTQ